MPIPCPLHQNFSPVPLPRDSPRSALSSRNAVLLFFFLVLLFRFFSFIICLHSSVSIFHLEDMSILTSHFLSAQQPHVASGSRFSKVLDYFLVFSLSFSLTHTHTHTHTHSNLIFSTTYRSLSFPVRMGQQPLLRQLYSIMYNKCA